MKINKVFAAVMSSIGFRNNTTSYIKTENIDKIREIPVTSIVEGFEYYETYFGGAFKFKVTKSIEQDNDGTWKWEAKNLKNNDIKTIECPQEGKAYWPNIFVA